MMQVMWWCKSCDYASHVIMQVMINVMIKKNAFPKKNFAFGENWNTKENAQRIVAFVTNHKPVSDIHWFLICYTKNVRVRRILPWFQFFFKFPKPQVVCFSNLSIRIEKYFKFVEKCDFWPNTQKNSTKNSGLISRKMHFLEWEVLSEFQKFSHSDWSFGKLNTGGFQNWNSNWKRTVLGWEIPFFV
jgi:hypothetical protein